MKKVICFYRCSFLIVLGVVGGVMSSTVQAEFLDDASGKLTLRNFYLDRNYVGDTEQARASGCTQSFRLDTKSGFTDGTVGFGLDALGLLSVKLDGGRGMGVTQLLPVDARSEEHTSELQSHRDLHSFPTRRSSDLYRWDGWVWFGRTGLTVR